MGRKSKIDWCEASEEEFDYIKEKYARPMVALTIGFMLVFLMIVAAVIFMIDCNIKKHDIGAIICSVFVYLIMLIIMVATIYVIVINIRRISCIYRRKFLVSDATVQSFTVRTGTKGPTQAKVHFITSTGAHISLPGTGLEPLAEKGKHALILNFEKLKKKDWQFVVKE